MRFKTYVTLVVQYVVCEHLKTTIAITCSGYLLIRSHFSFVRSYFFDNIPHDGITYYRHKEIKG